MRSLASVLHDVSSVFYDYMLRSFSLLTFILKKVSRSHYNNRNTSAFRISVTKKPLISLLG